MMLFLLPLIISMASGTFLLAAWLGRERPRLILVILLGTLLGLGLSGLLTWSSFVVFNRFVRTYVIAVNLALALAAALAAYRRNGTLKLWRSRTPDPWDIAGLILVALLTVPVILHAAAYPYGGWDAWSCWNFKARMLFLGGTDWRNLFDPVVWGSNISYPLLLPLMNVWAWSFGTAADPNGPMAMSCLISGLTAGILLFGVKELCRHSPWSLLAPLSIFTCAFNIKLASSQYSDLLVGAWFLAALIFFMLYQRTRHSPYLFLNALTLGFLAFTKTEGLVLAGITAGLNLVILSLDRSIPDQAKMLVKFFAILAVAFIPMMSFLIFFAPDSHTFINGLTSVEKPAGAFRLQATLIYLGRELMSLKWNGFWPVCLIGLILSRSQCFRRELVIIPLAIALYLGAIGIFYYVNTFFEIIWWLSTTLNRILFSLTPAMVLWLFLALEDNKK
jgi:hypothetical protein